VNGLGGAVYWGHAKGVTHPVNAGVSVHRWARLLFCANLDYWPVVAGLLNRFPVAGALKKVGYGFQGSPSTWHYSGGEYWVRNDVCGELWKRIDKVWWGTESWPGVHWQEQQAGCIFHQGLVPTLDMYSLPYVVKLEQEFEQWKLQNSMNRTRIG
jgi:hypothetical protein